MFFTTPTAQSGGKCLTCLTLSRHLGAALLTAILAGNVHAQSPRAPETAIVPLTLKQTFDAVWERQPEAQAWATRQAADEARRQSAESWTAAPPSLDLSSRTDQFNKKEGKREYIAGVTLPLWLPGESAQTRALAEAEAHLSTQRIQAAQLRAAEAVRAAWWNWHRAYSEKALAQTRLANTAQLAADVAQRVKAGDLARADQHQAEGAQAAAEADLAAATGAMTSASHALNALSGIQPTVSDTAPLPLIVEPLPSMPAVPEYPSGTETALPQEPLHPAVAELSSRAEVARRSVALARTQNRANPELTLSTTNERDTFRDDYQQSIAVGIRIPFSSAPRNQTRIALAQAEAIEAETLARLESDRLASVLAAERARIESVTTQLAAAEKRVRLARDSRAFFQKAFLLGEIDLPNRLRIDLEAAEAERQLVRARIERAAAISDLRQALGLLPE